MSQSWETSQSSQSISQSSQSNQSSQSMSQSSQSNQGISQSLSQSSQSSQSSTWDSQSSGEEWLPSDYEETDSDKKYLEIKQYILLVMELSQTNKFDCGNIIHEELIKLDYIDCPFCDEELQQPTIKIIPCCEKEDIINNKGTNIFRNCGSFHSYGTAPEYVDFCENKHRFIKKSVYQRKYHLDNILNDLSSKNGF